MSLVSLVIVSEEVRGLNQSSPSPPHAVIVPLASFQCRRPYYLSRNPFLGGMRDEPKRCLRWRLAALIVSG